ncbi:copper transporter, partial [Kineococcus glutinatus]|uniref:copper transporter n=1 Tax=Kineococcus glutinatus TaxID=1070872 RepID=UPI0031EDE73E
MIDFRYHLVSLVSVFLALAVGIVLGAGPLKEGIDVGITDQVRQLTAEKADLRSQLDGADRAITARDEWAEVVEPALVAGRLTGRSIVLVLLPGAEASLADDLATGLTAAGASVTGRVAVSEAWTDPAQDDVRSAVVAELGSTGQSTDARLATALAGALVTSDPALVAQPEDPLRTVLPVFADNGLVDVDGDLTQRASLAVAVAGPADTAPSAAQTEERSESLTTLLTGLDAASDGVVLAGAVEASAEEGLIADVRAADAAEAVSTVDDADVPMGRVSVV